MQSFPSLPAVLVCSCMTVAQMPCWVFFFFNAVFVAVLRVNFAFFFAFPALFFGIFKSKEGVERFPFFPTVWACSKCPLETRDVSFFFFVVVVAVSLASFKRSSAFRKAELCLSCLVYADEMFSRPFFALVCHNSANCYAITCDARWRDWLGSAVALPECDPLRPVACWLQEVSRWFGSHRSVETCREHRFRAKLGRAFALGSNVDVDRQRWSLLPNL